LESNFGKDWKVIYNKLEQIGSTLPYKYENLRKTKVMSLGMDVGIDKDKSLYLYEINGAPITSPLLAEVVDFRTKYYQYLLDGLSN